MSNKKVVAIKAISFILYTFFLFCSGLFGVTAQQYAINGGMYALKYGAVLLGFVMIIYLPNRINKALIQRKEEKYQRESEARIAQAAENEKKAQEKIIEAIRNEEAV